MQITVENNIVTVDGRVLEPFKYRTGRRQLGSVFYDEVNKIFIKTGKERAESERGVWEDAGEQNLQHHLAPLIASGPDWNAFSEVIPDDEKQLTTHSHQSHLWKKIEELFEMLGIGDSSCSGNWCTVKGVVVFLDYET